MNSSMAKSTRTLYQKAWQKCKEFITIHLKMQVKLPLSEQHLHLYIAHLHSIQYKHSTIATHISAISHYHKIASLPDPTTTYATAKILTGVKNSQVQLPDARRPVTRKILLGLVVALRSCTDNQYEYLLYKSLFTLMYYACLRASEVIQTDTPQHIINVSQIQLLADHRSYRLHLNSFKHSNPGGFTIYVTSTTGQDCPVTSLTKYLKQRGSQPGPLYTIIGSPLTRHQFTRKLNHCLTYLNLPHRVYNTHSFRIGRTTDMAASNVPHTTIQHIGRWKSNAYLRYVRPAIITTMP